MNSFIYTCSPSRVIFGSGTLEKLPDEIARLNLSSVLILSTPQQRSEAERVQKLIPNVVSSIFANATMHTPLGITNDALKALSSIAAAGIISIGGGSTIGLGKAIGVRTGLPHICIPTTYAGSEMTPILGETVDGLKTTRRDSRILPGIVIYDVDLTMTLPKQLSSTSGMNAIAHAVEALYAPDSNPIIRLLAKEGISFMSRALKKLVKYSQDPIARGEALYAAWLCGVCLGSTTMSLHHKICHTLGGSFNLPHAEVHTIMLPHSVAYNSAAAESAMRDLSSALSGSSDDPIEILNSLLVELGVERSLARLGFQEVNIARAAELAMENRYNNPRPLEKNALEHMLRSAWAGKPASAST